MRTQYARYIGRPSPALLGQTGRKNCKKQPPIISLKKYEAAAPQGASDLQSSCFQLAGDGEPLITENAALGQTIGARAYKELGQLDY